MVNCLVQALGTIWEAPLQRKTVCPPLHVMAYSGPTQPWDTLNHEPPCYSSLTSRPAETFVHLFTCWCFASYPCSFGKCKSLRRGSSYANTWQWGRRTFTKMQVLMDLVPRILVCDKSFVQPVWLGAGSLPWLRAATAGTSSSVMLWKSGKEQVSCAAGTSLKTSIKFMPHILPVNTKTLKKSMTNSCIQ